MDLDVGVDVGSSSPDTAMNHNGSPDLGFFAFGPLYRRLFARIYNLI